MSFVWLVSQSINQPINQTNQLMITDKKQWKRKQKSVSSKFYSNSKKRILNTEKIQTLHPYILGTFVPWNFRSQHQN